MALLYLGLGANIGDREQTLYRALEALDRRVGAVSGALRFIRQLLWGLFLLMPF